jgi:hypothetical protein
MEYVLEGNTLMNIGIFGDSHADCDYLAWKEYHREVEPGWPELLASTRRFSVTNFAKGGSGTYYSYQLFLKHHSQFDKVIFISSSTGRFNIQLSDRNQQIIPGFVHAVEPELKRYPKDSLDYKTLSAAIDYCKYVMDFDKELIFNQLLTSNVSVVRPDVIYIPAFQQNQQLPNDCIVLADVSAKEEELLNTTRAELRKGVPKWDVRKCHISEEHNNILYKKVLHAIDNNQQFAYLTEADIIKPSKPISFYFKPTLNGMPGNV